MPDQGAATRERLLRATIELIAQAGWCAVSTRAVAERAGVNQALVHYHYGSVGALRRAAAQAALAATFGPAMARLTETDDPADGLQAALAALGKIDPQAPQSLVVLEATVQAVRDGELGSQVRQLLAAFRAELAARLAAAAGRGRLSARVQPDPLAAALTALLDGLVLHRLIDPGVDAGAALAAVLALAAPAQSQRNGE